MTTHDVRLPRPLVPHNPNGHLEDIPQSLGNKKCNQEDHSQFQTKKNNREYIANQGKTVPMSCALQHSRKTIQPQRPFPYLQQILYKYTHKSIIANRVTDQSSFGKPTMKKNG